MYAYAFLAGDCPELRREDCPKNDDFILAADGGYRHLMRLGLTPALLLGDFDSLDSAELAQAEELGVQVIKWHEDKDFSDADLAIQELSRRGYDQVRLCGALGGDRFDHALANIGMMALWKRRGVEIELLHGNLLARVIEQQSLKLLGTPGDIVSLLPLSSTVDGVFCEGMRFPLCNETLFAGQTRSLSNALSTDEAIVKVAAGMLLVMHYRS